MKIVTVEIDAVFDIEVADHLNFDEPEKGDLDDIVTEIEFYVGKGEKAKIAKVLYKTLKIVY